MLRRRRRAGVLLALVIVTSLAGWMVCVCCPGPSDGQAPGPHAAAHTETGDHDTQHHPMLAPCPWMTCRSPALRAFVPVITPQTSVSSVVLSLPSPRNPDLPSVPSRMRRPPSLAPPFG